MKHTEAKLFRIYTDTRIRAGKEGRCRPCSDREAFRAVADLRGDKEQIEIAACRCRTKRTEETK